MKLLESRACVWCNKSDWWKLSAPIRRAPFLQTSVEMKIPSTSDGDRILLLGHCKIQARYMFQLGISLRCNWIHRVFMSHKFWKIMFKHFSVSSETVGFNFRALSIPLVAQAPRLVRTPGTKNVPSLGAPRLVGTKNTCSTGATIHGDDWWLMADKSTMGPLKKYSPMRW